MGYLLLPSIFLFIFVNGALAANILIIGTVISHSHHFWIESIALGLVKNGHNVTFLSHDYSNVKRDNYTVLTLNGVYEIIDVYEATEMDQFNLTPFNLKSFVENFLNYDLFVCGEDIKHEQVQNVLLRYPENYKFDLIMWDVSSGECLFPLMERFGNPPLVALSPYGLTNTVDDIFGGHIYPYVGQVVMPFVEARTLAQRMYNALFINYFNYKRNNEFKDKHVELSRSISKHWNQEKYEDIEKKFAIALVNWNVALNQAQEMPPNIIPVGGVQIKENATLTKELHAIFSKAKSGVIYFSLGSNIKSETIPADILNSIGKCFETIRDYEIIWKIQLPEEVKMPANVHTLKWAPQTNILLQSKTKLFITHGGGLSIQETSYCGKPILGIPIFLDQVNNIRKLMEKGGGEMLKLGDLRTSSNPQELFCRELKQVLYNEKYLNVMNELSMKYRDVPVKPLDSAIFWTEYVLRHGNRGNNGKSGFEHLNPLSRSTSVIFTQNLDIYFCALLITSIIIYIIVKMLKCVLNLICIKSKAKQKIN